MKLSRTRVWMLAALIAVSGVAGPSADHAWGDYHWARTANPFTLPVGNHVSPTWEPYLDEAIFDWSQSAVLDLVKVPGTKSPHCRAKAGRIEACSDHYGETGWLGIAQIWINGSHITQAVTKVNDTYFDAAPYNTPAWRRIVMCQEIAHDFGLNHQDEIFDNVNLGSCMDYTRDPVGPLSNEHPNAHDFEQLEVIYSHLDGTTTVGAARPSRLETPSAWGRLVHSSANGRVQVFEQDGGQGRRVLTRVLWADPDRDRE